MSRAPSTTIGSTICKRYEVESRGNFTCSCSPFQCCARATPPRRSAPLLGHVDSRPVRDLIVNSERSANTYADCRIATVAAAAHAGADCPGLLVLNALQKDTVCAELGRLLFHAADGLVHVL